MGNAAMAARPTMVTSVFNRRRAVIMIVKKISSSRNAVPKSGCLAISSTGAPAIATGITKWRQVRSSSAGESFK